MSGGRPIRFGVLRLADSAPAIVGVREGIFSALGLDVQICVEPSWVNIADKLAYGLLDAASMLPPLALAAEIGLRGPPSRLVVPMALSAAGNTITVATGVADAVLDPDAGGSAAAIGGRFAAWLRTQSAPPRFAVVHAFSTHNLLLRHWLAAAGIDPDRDIETVVIAPEAVETALARGTVVGFCAGAPWGAVAAERGSGRILLQTDAIWPAHPEKCLAVFEPWASSDRRTLDLLLRGLLQAQRACDSDAAALTAALADAPLHLPEAATRAALAESSVRFFAGNAWIARRAHARWFLAAMQRWRWLDRGIDIDAAASRIYRPDLADAAAAVEGLGVPGSVYVAGDSPSN